MMDDNLRVWLYVNVGAILVGAILVGAILVGAILKGVETLKSIILQIMTQISEESKVLPTIYCRPTCLPTCLPTMKDYEGL
jgi:hypothetical protein